MSLSPSRRRGAQLGNSNALKHGFYTHRFKQRDLSGVVDTSLKDLAEEIALIRVFTRKLVETVDPSANFYQLAGILRAICLASSALTRIIKAQAFLVNEPTNFYAEIDEALRQARVEMGIDDPPPNLTSGDEPR